MLLKHCHQTYEIDYLGALVHFRIFVSSVIIFAIIFPYMYFAPSKLSKITSTGEQHVKLTCGEVFKNIGLKTDYSHSFIE